MRKGRPYKEKPFGYVGIWSQIQDNSTFRALLAICHPLPTLRSRDNADLTQSTSLMGTLAGVTIAVSSIQKWPRHDWETEMDDGGSLTIWKPGPDSMEECLSSHDKLSIYLG